MNSKVFKCPILHPVCLTIAVTTVQSLERNMSNNTTKNSVKNTLWTMFENLAKHWFIGFKNLICCNLVLQTLIMVGFRYLATPQFPDNNTTYQRTCAQRFNFNPCTSSRTNIGQSNQDCCALSMSRIHTSLHLEALYLYCCDNISRLRFVKASSPMCRESGANVFVCRNLYGSRRILSHRTHRIPTLHTYTHNVRTLLLLRWDLCTRGTYDSYLYVAADVVNGSRNMRVVVRLLLEAVSHSRHSASAGGKMPLGIIANLSGKNPHV